MSLLFAMFELIFLEMSIKIFPLFIPALREISFGLCLFRSVLSVCSLGLSRSLSVSLGLSLSRSLVLALSFSALLAHVGARECTFFPSLTIGEGIGGRAADGEGNGSVVYREGKTM